MVAHPHCAGSALTWSSPCAHRGLGRRALHILAFLVLAVHYFAVLAVIE